MKVTIILSVILLCVVVSCTENKTEDTNHKVEQELTVSFNENFQRPYQVSDSLNAVECYSKTEDYFRFIGVLSSTDKSGYLKFYNEYIMKDTDVSLQCLFRTHPSTEFILLPSNLTIILENYRTVDSKQSNSTLKEPINSLNKFIDEYEISFREPEHFQAYLNSIPDSKFENNIVYRIPLLAFSLSEFDLR